MDASVLMQALKMMDDNGIGQHGVDVDRHEYYPAIVLDGHIS